MVLRHGGKCHLKLCWKQKHPHPHFFPGWCKKSRLLPWSVFFPPPLSSCLAIRVYRIILTGTGMAPLKKAFIYSENSQIVKIKNLKRSFIKKKNASPNDEGHQQIHLDIKLHIDSFIRQLLWFSCHFKCNLKHYLRLIYIYFCFPTLALKKPTTRDKPSMGTFKL